MSIKSKSAIPIAMLLPLLLLLGQANAATAVLSGACFSGSSPSGQYINFSIFDSGNASVTNMLLTPDFVGLNVTSYNSIGLVGPGNNYSVRFYTNNGTKAEGEYAGAIIARYSQGSSEFFTSFPCLANFGNALPSLTSITSKRIGNKIEGEVFNIGKSTYNVSVYMFVPPGFTVSPQFLNYTIKPNSAANYSFTFSEPNETGVSTSFAIGSSYESNGVHYASLGIYSISLGKPASVLNLGLITIYAGAAVVAALVALIIYSRFVRKKHKAPEA